MRRPMHSAQSWSALKTREGVRMSKTRFVGVSSASPSRVATTRRPYIIEESDSAENITRYELDRNGELIEAPSTSPSTLPSAITSSVDFEPAASNRLSHLIAHSPPALYLKHILLPNGFPNSVSPDYLRYQLWALPTHITGVLSMSLVTSSMLKALGLSAGPAGTVALGASTKWILKDGIGALGRFLVGGNLSRNFDSDPKYWRFLGELITTGGIALEIATILRPDYFLVLAGAGTLTRAVAKGVAKPSFRVMQSHFAFRNNNIGDVSAKEEVWEVFGQLMGIGLATMVLNHFEQDQNPYGLLATWAAVQASHVVFRYTAISQLELRSLNCKRVVQLVETYLDERRILTFAEAAKKDNLLMMAEWTKPNLEFVPLRSVLEDGNARGTSMASLLDVFEDEKFVLHWQPDQDRGRVALQEDASGADVVKAYALACSLRRGLRGDERMPGRSHAAGALAWDDMALRTELRRVNDWFPKFLKEAEASQWNFAMSNVVIIISDARFRRVAVPAT